MKLTCHMGSHSVTCHPTEVRIPLYTHSHLTHSHKAIHASEVLTIWHYIN